MSGHEKHDWAVILTAELAQDEGAAQVIRGRLKLRPDGTVVISDKHGPALVIQAGTGATVRRLSRTFTETAVPADLAEIAGP